MKITIVTGSRADWGLLEWPIKTLQEDAYFQGQILKVWGATFDQSFRACTDSFTAERPDMMLCLGDRFEILAAATAAHLLRVPIAHIGGGDVTEGSYDDAMRDCISRMATVHFVTSTSAMARLSHLGLRNVHLVGNPGIDYIRGSAWKQERPIAEPYVVVSYQAETIDGTIHFGSVLDAVNRRRVVFIMPNADAGSDTIRKYIQERCEQNSNTTTSHDFLSHAEYLNLIFHCDELIGNSSSLLYEAPELGIKTRMIGKRQRGRTIPFGDGNASARMVNILKHCAL